MNSRMMRFIAAVTLIITTGCSTDRDVASLLGPQETGVPVVDALLLVGQPLPPIYLSQTQRVDSAYDPENAALKNAVVAVTGDGKTFEYLEARPGVYTTSSEELVLPQTEYRLQIMASGNRSVSAVTVTPKRPTPPDWLLLNQDLTIRRKLKTYEELGEGVYDAPENQLNHSDGLLEAAVNSDDVQGFQVGVFSLDPGSDFAIDVSFLDEEDLDDFERETSSPVLSSSENRLRLPWFAIFFKGRYKLKVFAVDANWYDYLRTSPNFQGGFGFGGNAGDNFERPIFHLDGGIGLFGAAAVDSVGFTILPQLGSE